MAQDDLREHCVELLAPLGPVRWRRMFGGIGIYVDGLFVAIIAGERLFLKAAPEFRPRFEAAGCEPFVYSAKTGSVALGYWSAPPDAMESPALMQPWARLALQSALAARNAKPPVRKRAASTTPTRAKKKPAPKR